MILQMVRIIENRSIREFFEERLDEVVSENPVSINDLTRSYLVGLLTEYVRSDVAFSLSRDDPEMPLSVKFLQTSGKGTREKVRNYKLIGDFCLFLSGFFSDFIQQKLADQNFYITIGSRAYSNVESSLKSATSLSEESFIPVFRELSEKFPDLVDLCMDMSERMQPMTGRNIISIYEKYLLYRSKRYEKILKEAGIVQPPLFPSRH